MDDVAKIINALRENSRQSVRSIAAQTCIPKSTVFDYMGSLQLRYCSLLDEGFVSSYFMIIDPSQLTVALNSPFLNRLSKLSNGMFFVELLLPSKQLLTINGRKIFPVIHIVKRESATIDQYSKNYIFEL